MVTTKETERILQSIPVSFLNRDEVGAPKKGFVGGVNRARLSTKVSSGLFVINPTLRRTKEFHLRVGLYLTYPLCLN